MAVHAEMTRLYEDGVVELMTLTYGDFEVMAYAVLTYIMAGAFEVRRPAPPPPPSLLAP